MQVRISEKGVIHLELVASEAAMLARACDDAADGLDGDALLVARGMFQAAAQAAAFAFCVPLEVKTHARREVESLGLGA
jgi:hypothetical protein